MHRVINPLPMEMHSVSHNSLQDPLLDEAHEAPSEPQRSSYVNWPVLPISLKDSSKTPLMRLLPNALLLLIPLAFYVLGIFIFRLNGQIKELEYDPGDTVIQATKIASTLWPILFAMVVGSMIKAITLYHAERGTTLGTLEVLTTSQTLASTLRGCFAHRIISIWTAILVAIWILSPAGGQAVLRSVELHKQLHEYRLTYYPSDDIYSNFNFSPMDGTSTEATAKYDMQQVVDGTFSSPDSAVLFSKGFSGGFDAAVERLGGEAQAAQSARMDLWGNVRIPFLHLLPGYDDNDRSKWIEISQSTIAPYSSLIGHTIRKVPLSSVGNFSLPLQTFYHNLTCLPWFNGTEWVKSNPGRLLSHVFSNITTAKRSTEIFNQAFLDIIIPENITLPEPPKMPLNDVDKAIVVFGIRGSMDVDDAMFYQINMTHCETTAIYVETEVNCVRASAGLPLSCTTLRMRETPGKLPSNWSTLNWGNIEARYIQYFPDIGEASLYRSRSLMELFLNDPPSSFNPSTSSKMKAMVNYDSIPLDIFQARLSLVLNTLYHGSLNTSNFIGADGVNGIAQEDISPKRVKQYGNTTGTWTEFTPSRYTINYHWFALYLAATTILGISAVATVIISALNRAPDLFGGVSSLTRDSAFMTTVPDGGSSLSGSERARLLQDVWVRIQDVKPEDDVGRIAFSDQKELGVAAGLRWERKYT